MELPTSSVLFFALLGGIIPALLWLFFWLTEDRRCPEPRGLIGLAFVAGMITVLFVIPVEQFAESIFVGSTVVIVLWAIIEEVFKFISAYVVVLRNKATNEPIDEIIYMITIALGFAAFENTLFLLSPLSDGFVVQSILTGNLRFIGATLVHTLASATVGIAMAFSFYYSRRARILSALLGLILASSLHALFNLFILRSNGGGDLLVVFSAVWIGVIVLILLFEKVKRIRNFRGYFIRRNN